MVPSLSRITWISRPAGMSRSRRFKKMQKFLVLVALHGLPDDGAVKHVQGGKQSRCAVADIVMRHRPGAALFHRQARLGAVERLDLRFLVDGEHQAVRRRVAT
jgi:hypothetical protein